MNNDLDAQFLQRISRVENDLLSLNHSSVDDFNHHWAAFVVDLKVAIEADSLSDSTITLAYSIATRVSRVLQTFLDLEALAAKLMSSLLEETATAECSTSNSSPMTRDSAFPPYIKLSYDWLVENICNPYPSINIRDAIARKSGAARKDIDNWFIDARKRIGWNAARKTHFLNKRVVIVDAATRFYANDEKLSLSQGAEHALISIMKNAKDLYCDKFDETILAAKLTAVVKDLTPETKAAAKAERVRQAQLMKDRNSYPSPDRSPEPARLLVDTCDDRIDNTVVRKRRRPSVKEPTELDLDEGRRPDKRIRFNASSPKSLAFPAGLPSPAPSADEYDPLQTTQPVDCSSPSLPASIVAGRKRRLSESDCQNLPESPRPRRLPIAPPVQTFSDSLPLSDNLLFDETSFDGWFQQVFDRPENGEISPSSFSVELGNLSDFDRKTSNKPCPPEISGQTSKTPAIEAVDAPTVSDAPWNEFDLDWTDHSHLPLDNLGPLNTLMNFEGQEPLHKPLAQNLLNQQVSQASRPTNEYENFFGLSNSPAADSVVIPFIPVSNETWDFSGSCLNRDGTALSGKHHAGFENINGLFDAADFLSVTDAMFLPTLSSAKSRKEKEKEFRDACEKAQRLALELQKDDLFA
ncbi:hypothetical protein C0992_009354 [Termitomyces sp. T32_za158]|nr:hypothetical protein C0992_009354 [Termitomyces sp. T32_za158]